MNKKILTFGLMAMFALVFVSAIYIVSSFSIKSDVMEPFDNVQYVVLSSDYSYYQNEDCSQVLPEEYTTFDQSESPFDIGGIYAGEARKICVKFDNLANAYIDYTLSVVSNDCEDVFSEDYVQGQVTD